MPDRDSRQAVGHASDNPSTVALQWPRLLLLPIASLRNRNLRLFRNGQSRKASTMWSDEVASSLAFVQI